MHPLLNARSVDLLSTEPLDLSTYTFKTVSTIRRPILFDSNIAQLLGMKPQSIINRPGKIYGSREIRDGLFQKAIKHGEYTGKVWMHVNLPEPIPTDFFVRYNPVTRLFISTFKVAAPDIYSNVKIRANWEYNFILMYETLPVSAHVYKVALTEISAIAHRMDNPVVIFQTMNPKRADLYCVLEAIKAIKFYKEMTQRPGGFGADIQIKVLDKVSYFLTNLLFTFYGGLSSHHAETMTEAFALAHQLRNLI